MLEKKVKEFRRLNPINQPTNKPMPEYLLNSISIYVYTTQILQKNDFRNTMSISKTKAE
jgi:hypothetical protein